MIVERTLYFAKPGRAADVLATRRDASRIRVGLGLKAGRISVKTDGEGPDVSWQCSYHSEAEHRADLDARAASPDFEAIRARMRGNIERFERHIETQDRDPDEWRGDVSLDGVPIVPTEHDFRSGDLSLKGYLFVPPGTGPFPCMVLNHGSGINQGTLDISRPNTASWLMSWGIASFLPHRRGYGNSPGIPWREDCPAPFGTPEYDDQLARRLDAESDDVLAALAHVKTLASIRADRIGVMGSSFGGTNTLLAASKSTGFRCAVDFAGAAMNWDRTPRLRELMTSAALKVPCPIFYAQAANDYSIRPTVEIAEALKGTDRIFEAKVYPAHGFNNNEGHLLESAGQLIWGADIRRFLERWL
jgi:carboxymethylenebutenolidase